MNRTTNLIVLIPFSAMTVPTGLLSPVQSVVVFVCPLVVPLPLRVRHSAVAVPVSVAAGPNLGSVGFVALT